MDCATTPCPAASSCAPSWRLREELEFRRLPALPPEALRALPLSVNAEAAARAGRPEARGMDIDWTGDSEAARSSKPPPDAADGQSGGAPPLDPDGSGGGGSAPAGADRGGGDPPQDAADAEPALLTPDDERGAADGGAATAVEMEPGEEPAGAEASTQQASALVPPPSADDVALREAGVALVLPAPQALLDPLEPFLEAHWGDQPWYYRPLDMILAFTLAPCSAVGGDLPASRPPALAAHLPLAEELRQRLAEAYLRLG